MELVIRRGSLKSIADMVNALRPHRVAVITDKRVATLHLEKLNGLEYTPLILPEGESTKSLTFASMLWEKLLDAGFTRKSVIIGLGGGVITDLAGFVASTFMRGVSLLLAPTTLLAQIDAAIGGKTGINFRGKNMVGTFYLPRYIVIDPDVLHTLPPEEWSNGYGELVKYAILSRDIHGAVMRGSGVNEDIIERCVRYKLSIVNQDLKEHGIRRVLNLGHTFAHALEKYYGYKIKHGVAVAQGLRFSALLGEKLYGFDPAEVNALLMKFGLDGCIPFKPIELLRAMRNDKKFWYGKMTLVVPVEIGTVKVVDVEESLILRTLGEMPCSQG